MVNKYKIPDNCFVCRANPYCPKDVEPESHACKIHRAWEEKLEKCPECGEQMFEPPPGIKIIKAQRALIDELKRNLVEQSACSDATLIERQTHHIACQSCPDECCCSDCPHYPREKYLEERR